MEFGHLGNKHFLIEVTTSVLMIIVLIILNGNLFKPFDLFLWARTCSTLCLCFLDVLLWRLLEISVVIFSVLCHSLQGCKTKTGWRNILCSIQKEQKGWWERLLKSAEKTAPFLKVDWNKWCDEDDEESECKFSLYLNIL